jgi:hypothetical protein
MSCLIKREMSTDRGHSARIFKQRGHLSLVTWLEQTREEKWDAESADHRKEVNPGRGMNGA